MFIVATAEQWANYVKSTNSIANSYETKKVLLYFYHKPTFNFRPSIYDKNIGERAPKQPATRKYKGAAVAYSQRALYIYYEFCIRIPPPPDTYNFDDRSFVVTAITTIIT